MKIGPLFKFSALIVFVFTANAMGAQTFHVAPYLQDGSPSSMRVMWETSGGSAAESHVEWGLTEALGNTAAGTAAAATGTARSLGV